MSSEIGKSPKQLQGQGACRRPGWRAASARRRCLRAARPRRPPRGGAVPSARRRRVAVHAIVVSTPGDVSVLQWEAVEDPAAAPGEVVIDRRHRRQSRRHLAADGPLRTAAGSVAVPGSGVQRSHRVAWRRRLRLVGRRRGVHSSPAAVCNPCLSGVELLLPLPHGVSLVDAAGLPEAVCTVWSNVFMMAGLQPGETLLVHGGASGIGTIAVQLGQQLGARVLVTAGSPAKIERCIELGAEAGIDYRTEDFVERVTELNRTDGAPTSSSTTWVRRTPNATSPRSPSRVAWQSSAGAGWSAR